MKLIFRPSPNFTKGRSQKIRGIVIHWAAGGEEGSLNTLTNPATKVSAHYMVSNDGERIYKLVDEKNTAYHSRSANPYSVGIENVASWTNPFKGYETTAQLCADICKRYGLNPKKAIHGHRRYVATTCPGTISVSKVRKMTSALMEDDMTIEQLYGKIKGSKYIKGKLQKYGRRKPSSVPQRTVDHYLKRKPFVLTNDLLKYVYGKLKKAEAEVNKLRRGK